MDDAVARLDVGGHNVGLVNHSHAVADHERHRAALYGVGRHAIAEVARHDLARHHMVEQDLRQLALRIFEQGFDGARRQGGKGVIGWRKDREWPLALQRLHQAGRLDGGDERSEVACAHGGIDNVGHFAHRGFRGCFGRRLGGGGRNLGCGQRRTGSDQQCGDQEQCKCSELHRRISSSVRTTSFGTAIPAQLSTRTVMVCLQNTRNIHCTMSVQYVIRI